MLGAVSVRVTAGHPDIPLRKIPVFVGSAMTVEVVDAPRTGNGVTIESVSVSAENAIGAVVTIAATRNGGVWTATIPASHFAAVGVVAMGVTISASGTDENGAARSWIIGKGDLTILPADGVPVPGETLQNVHLRDSVPETPQKGDLCEGANGWQIYTGEAWAVIAPSPSTSAPLMDGTASAGTSAAYARGNHVHPTDTSRMAASATGANILSGRSGAPPTETITEAFSSIGYDLGTIGGVLSEHTSNTTIHVTSTEKATWNGKQNALSAQQLANIAAVPNKADASAIPYTLGTAITTGSAQMADRTINAVNLGANNVTATFPDAVTGKARDFLLLVSKAADATGDITITAPTSATIYGDSLAQTIATGETWLFGVTELAANVFLVKAEKMEVAS